jgi:hypothetical protein
MSITRKRWHEALLDLGIHSGNTDAKFDPPPDPAIRKQTPLPDHQLAEASHDAGHSPQP